MVEKFQKDNSVIAYINDKAIVIDDDSEIFFVEIPQEFVTLGETMLEDDLTPLSTLSFTEQYYILSKLNEGA